MKQQELTLYQVIAILSQIENKDKVFSRVGDNKFKIFKGSYGDLIYKIENSTNKSTRPLPIFNYMQDKWVMINE